MNFFKTASFKTGSLKLHTPYILLMSYLTAIIALSMRPLVTTIDKSLGDMIPITARV